MIDIMSNELKEGRALPWERREQWAKEIIEAVSQIHSKGFVAGTFGHVNDLPVAIDVSDRAMLWNFHNKLWTGEEQAGYMPPEFRALRRHGKTSEQYVNATPKTDIFHLGMVLWLLAVNITPISTHHFCRNSNCQRPAGAPCYEVHADPIALPSLSSHVPQYYRDIVSHCRATNPSSRPSAWRLLQLFPRGTTHTDIQKSPNTLSEEIKTLIWMSRSVPENIYCDICRECY
jgi:serine/threonine protein kinase